MSNKITLNDAWRNRPDHPVLFTIVTLHYRGTQYLDGLVRNLSFLRFPSNNFEWIVVDDHSNDSGKSCAAILNEINNCAFAAAAILLEKNFYGTRSVIEACGIARGQYIVILDQDDHLKPDALEVFRSHIEQQGHAEDFAGVCGRCEDPSGNIITPAFPASPLYASEQEVRHLYRIRGEMFQCTRTDLVKLHFQDMKPGLTNGWAWARIAQTHRYAYVNDVVRLYNTDSPTSANRQKRVKYVRNVYSQSLEFLEANWRFARHDPVDFLGKAIHCVRWSLHVLGGMPQPILGNKPSMSLVFCLVSPISWLLYLRDRRSGLVTHDE